MASSARWCLLLVVSVLASTLCLPVPAGAQEKAAAKAEAAVSPIFGVAIPDGYRGWHLVAVSHRTDNKDELRAILGNDVAYKAYRAKKLPFPDGAILAKLAWQRVASPTFEGAWVPGVAPRIEFMVKDSRKYASTGGWGFGRFINGKPADEAQHRTCFPCHDARVKNRDWVFTEFAP